MKPEQAKVMANMKLDAQTAVIAVIKGPAHAELFNTMSKRALTTGLVVSMQSDPTMRLVVSHEIAGLMVDIGELKSKVLGLPDEEAISTVEEAIIFGKTLVDEIVNLAKEATPEESYGVH